MIFRNEAQRRAVMSKLSQFKAQNKQIVTHLKKDINEAKDGIKRDVKTIKKITK
jgi:hypothetical protein